MCIFLLKMREYFRWEYDIPFGRVPPKEEVGEWLRERERMWRDLESSPYEPLPLERGASDPFDSDIVNLELVPRGYVYSGGYGRFCKPYFFLGDLVRTEQRAGYTVYVSSCEYARDLEAPPAMHQGHIIYVRQESVRRFLWEKFEESKWNKNNAAMRRAFDCHPFATDVDRALDLMTQNETETMILHELGEGMAGDLLGEDWHAMLGHLSRSKAETVARAVRDLLADCLSTLPNLAAMENRPSLHFYFANFTGMRRSLFPEAMDAYNQWIANGDPGPLLDLAEHGVNRWQSVAYAILELYKRHGLEARGQIEKVPDRRRA